MHVTFSHLNKIKNVLVLIKIRNVLVLISKNAKCLRREINEIIIKLEPGRPAMGLASAKAKLRLSLSLFTF